MDAQLLRAIIVDDEALARRGIELRLREHRDVQIVAECGNGREAIEAVTREQPDLMFLDIQMPGLSGLDVIARVPHASMPIVVFVTAFDRYALDAFEAHALDYLLKPINEARFNLALDRVRVTWRQRTAYAQHDKLMRLLAATQGSSALDERTIRRELAQEPTSKYPDILKGLESALDPQVFQRVHRSTIVNVNRVRQLRPHTNGEYFLRLDDGQEIKLSRTYRDSVDRLLTPAAKSTDARKR
jgi:two-component system LytT family response regulator